MLPTYERGGHGYEGFPGVVAAVSYVVASDCQQKPSTMRHVPVYEQGWRRYNRRRK